MENFWSEILVQVQSLAVLDFLGLVFGLLNVLLLIRQNIYTWPAGIIYVLISLLLFWQIQLYGDFLLHLVFLVLNIYGWWFWIHGKKKGNDELEVSSFGLLPNLMLLALSSLGTWGLGLFLENIHEIWPNLEQASVPYWDATTSALSITGVWLMARKKIENWYYWFTVDVLACGIYFYKGIYFYSLLYGVYVVLAIAGYLEWRKSLSQSK